MIPADPTRCQAETLEGSFMTLGPRSWRRCSNKPTFIATEKAPGPDGKVGSMSVCDSCKPNLEKQRQDVLYMGIVK